MKTLYILRHAKSSWKDPSLSDHQRPLNKRGKRNVPDMGARLKARRIKPDLIISSDARRALDTAVPIARMIGVDPTTIRHQPALYHATQAQILKLVKGLDDRFRQVMVVGHNPGLTDLANRFLSQTISNLPTAGIVELQFDVDAWQAIDSIHLVHSSEDFPKNKP
ncbi:SixA: phosphohistidine phosphatase [Desulfosarcina variabilis str. Montpellier]|uniref:SixA phosphatase family protein n=1 Tax=Desulfosarcina variabilis TaxID=2300 RepID=UPI003AFADB8E